MIERTLILKKVQGLIASAGDVPVDRVAENMALIGPESALSSRQLIEVLLELEEFAEDELGTEFDWTSDSALSLSRSVLRTVGVLTDHLYSLSEKAQ